MVSVSSLAARERRLQWTDEQSLAEPTESGAEASTIRKHPDSPVEGVEVH